MVLSERQVLVSKDLICKQVTVYTDRAEVKRWMKLTLKSGVNEIVVSELPRTIDGDSVRVDGKGDASVLEVNFSTQPIKQGQEGQEKLKTLQDQLQSLRDNLNIVNQKQTRINHQREVLNKVTSNLGSTVSPSEKDSSLLLNAAPESLNKWLDYFDERSAQLDSKLVAVNAEKKSVEEEMQLVQRKINELGFSGGVRDYSREVSILIESEKGGDVELDVTYLVNRVSWKPFYDVRVFNADKTMKVYYYGKIEQTSGEDWKDTKIILSTAVPGIAGSIPWLPTLNVSSERHVERQVMKMREPMENSSRMRTMKGGGPMMFGAAVPCFAEEQMAADEMISMESDVHVLQSEVNDSGMTTTFEIARATTIPSDSSDHKVSVAILELEPHLRHVSVPSKTQLAYMKATTRNNTAYPLLPGPVSVFMDNNFVAKTHLKSVGVKEKFSVSLGADPAVKVEYKPAKKFAGESGFLSKATTTLNEHKVTFKNTKTEVVHMKLIMQIPRPTNDRVKVTLIEPEAKHHDEKHKGAQLTKDNLLEWTLDIPAGGNPLDVSIKYKVEHPADDDVNFSEDSTPTRFGIHSC